MTKMGRWKGIGIGGLYRPLRSDIWLEMTPSSRNIADFLSIVIAIWGCAPLVVIRGCNVEERRRPMEWPSAGGIGMTREKLGRSCVK